MKKIFALALALSMSLSLAACGSNNTPNNSCLLYTSDAADEI